MSSFTVLGITIPVTDELTMAARKFYTVNHMPREMYEVIDADARIMQAFYEDWDNTLRAAFQTATADLSEDDADDLWEALNKLDITDIADDFCAEWAAVSAV